MSDPVFTFVCTTTTYERVIPSNALSDAEFKRQTQLAFQSFVGGTTRAGDLLFRSTQDAVANHVLADGTVYTYEQFPELFSLYGSTFGGDGVTTFAVPDHSGAALTAGTITVTQEVSEGGTVTTGGVVTEPTQPGETGGTTGGNIPSGGRPVRVTSEFEV